MTPAHDQVSAPHASVFAGNADIIFRAALRHYPDLRDPQACREWLLAVHLALAMNAAERIFTMATTEVEPAWIEKECQNAVATIQFNAFEIYALAGADNDEELVFGTARAIDETFTRRLDELRRCAPMAGGCA